MLFFKMKRFLPYITISSGLSHSTANNTKSFYDSSKLFADSERSVNCFVDIKYLNLEYLLRKLLNETTK